jgi:hypothetical protein
MIYLLAIIKEVETKQDYDNDLISQSRQILNVCPEKRNSPWNRSGKVI